jgi:ATP-dependent Lon protease
MDSGANDEIDKLKKKIEELQLPEEAKKIVDMEI